MEENARNNVSDKRVVTSCKGGKVVEKDMKFPLGFLFLIVCT